MNSPSEQEPTPRTDNHPLRQIRAFDHQMEDIIPTEVARDLERELSRLRAELALRDAREEELKQSLEVLTNSEQMWMEQCSDAQARLVSMEAVVESRDAALRSIRQIVETPSEVPQLSLFEIDQVAEQALSLTPDQSLLESMHKEIEGLKGNLSDMATSFNKLNTAFGAQTKIWENTIKERDSLRSQLAETQSNYQTLLDAVNNEIELRKAAEDQLEEAQGKLKATGIEAEVCGDITNRQQLGITKYGQTVADNPAELGEWIQHAYEETLDNAVYLRRALQAIRSASRE